MPDRSTPADAPAADFASLADAGWPALERSIVAGTAVDGRLGWTARFAHGVTQRANSVFPAGSVDDVDGAIDGAEHLYRDRGLVPLFQISDKDAALSDSLLARGYDARNETLVLAAPMPAEAGRARVESETSVTVADLPDDDWLDLWWSVDGRGGGSARDVARRILTGGPALYATVRDERGAASVGRLALVEHQDTTWGGLYALATRPDARGRGHAHTTIEALTAAGADHGVTALWLQVLASNTAARRLYGRLGFRQVATYRYLVGSRAAE